MDCHVANLKKYTKEFVIVGKVLIIKSDFMMNLSHFLRDFVVHLGEIFINFFIISEGKRR